MENTWQEHHRCRSSSQRHKWQNDCLSGRLQVQHKQDRVYVDEPTQVRFLHQQVALHEADQSDHPDAAPAPKLHPSHSTLKARD